MFVQFYVQNYKTFKEKALFSMVASVYDKSVCPENLIPGKIGKDVKFLKSAVVYGKNAGGKSKLIEAMAFMRFFVLGSSKNMQAGEKIDVVPFLFSKESRGLPSEFEIVFISGDLQYRYGFEIDNSRVYGEWLYSKKARAKEVELLYRDKQDFLKVHSKLKIAGTLVKDKMVRENALLLSVAAQFNDDVAVGILNWFENFNIISSLVVEGFESLTISSLMYDEKKRAAVKFLQNADMGIDDLRVVEYSKENLPFDMPADVRERVLGKKMKAVSDVQALHPVYDALKMQTGEMVPLSLYQDESTGTLRYFLLSGPVLDVLKNGGVLVIDEMEVSLHPLLSVYILNMFHSEKMNPLGAQLVFTTHHTHLLNRKLFRRDQVWFVEKDRYGEASLFSLADFKAANKKVRNDEDYEKNYLLGRYGAVPYVDGEFDG